MIIGQILFVFFVVIISLVGTFPIEMMVILEAGSESGAPGWFRLRLDHPETQQKQVYIYPIGSMVLVYMLTWLGYINGKCYHIYHTWILWVYIFQWTSRNVLDLPVFLYFIYFSLASLTIWSHEFCDALRQVFLGTAPLAAPPAKPAPLGPEFTGPAAEEGDDGGMVGWDGAFRKAFWDDNRNG